MKTHRQKQEEALARWEASAKLYTSGMEAEPQFADSYWKPRLNKTLALIEILKKKLEDGKK